MKVRSRAKKDYLPVSPEGLRIDTRAIIQRAQQQAETAREMKRTAELMYEKAVAMSDKCVARHRI